MKKNLLSRAGRVRYLEAQAALARTFDKAGAYINRSRPHKEGKLSQPLCEYADWWAMRICEEAANVCRHPRKASARRTLAAVCNWPTHFSLFGGRHR